MNLNSLDCDRLDNIDNFKFNLDIMGWKKITDPS